MWSNNKNRLSLFALILYWLALNTIVLHASPEFFTVPNIEPINDVSYIVSKASSPQALPAHDAISRPWQPLTLPDDWHINHRDIDQIWYRTAIMLNAKDALTWGVYLPSITHNAAVFINGVWVGQGGSFKAPVSRHHNEPLLFSFSSALLHEGQNQIDIRLAASHPKQGLIDRFYVAPLDQLQAPYRWKHFIRVEFIQWLTLTMYIMSLVTLVFWLVRPEDKIYGLFALEIFLWATHNLNLFITEIPVSAHLWESMTMSTLGWTIVTMIFFNHRFLGESHPRLEKLMLLYALTGMSIFLLPNIGSILHIGYGIWDSFLMIFGGYAVYFLAKSYWQRPNTDLYLMLIVSAPILVFGLHDILLLNHYIDRTQGLIIQYSALPAMLLFGWFLIRRFAQAIQNAEQLAATLENRVEKKQQALKTQYEQLKVLENQQLLGKERERIMRDMHDGIGGQLVSIVAILQEQRGEVFDNVRHRIQLSLTDLRFVIDSLDPVLSDLPTLLGMMRVRLMSQLEAANIELKWAVTDLPDVPSMSPGRCLHIMRIIQEAITNSIKHSESKDMTLATGIIEDQQKIFIDIIDYGIGISAQATDTLGRGIRNMQYRAQQLDAQLQIGKLDSESGGTRIRLLLGYA